MPPTPPQSDAAPTIPLRILATSDLHMHVLGYDYFLNRPSEGFGLSRVAALIAAERRCATNTLLFDNGDSLQGSPMGDFLAEPGVLGPRGIHPAIAAMNALGYDAATIGNHDFSFGLGFLRRTLEGADFPVVASNTTSRRRMPLLRHALLQRRMLDRAGHAHMVRIGVLGFLPPQTADWEPDLRGEVAIGDILDAAKAQADLLRAEGADLIVALAHSGIGALEPVPKMENAATALAALPAIDVVIAGHSHRLFPGPDHPTGPGIDIAAGTLAGKPAVMPGFWGSHLGVIELELEPSGMAGRSWRPRALGSRVEPARSHEEQPLVLRPAMASHHATLRHFQRRIGRSDSALSSHFVLLGRDPGLRLVAMAQRWQVRKALAGTRWRDLAILSAAAPFRAGGRGGPEHYTDVPAGPLTLRNLADLYLFPNRLCALVLTGADVADWLERSASLFRQIHPGGQDQPLLDPEFPGYNFDQIDGLEWQIDLSRPPRYAPDGRLLHQGSRRVRDLCHRGRPVQDGQLFVLATNSYRLSDSGLFAPVIRRGEVILNGIARTRDVLRRYVSHRRVVSPEARLGWRFAEMPGTSVMFQTSPAAEWRHLPMPGQPLGLDSGGFLTLRLQL
ncbi:bifunctional 2',3'-cyclic-nucleotide 2'-phosphodiesterase/3'-nucleotidase [Paracoccus limosus]|nr:bifunctional 2',3'-cyclic-nucleotide 2'-phosphodiesterase/3'-nucleotidase [Paracoccus limosus]